MDAYCGQVKLMDKETSVSGMSTNGDGYTSTKHITTFEIDGVICEIGSFGSSPAIKEGDVLCVAGTMGSGKLQVYKFKNITRNYTEFLFRPLGFYIMGFTLIPALGLGLLILPFAVIHHIKNIKADKLIEMKIQEYNNGSDFQNAA